MSENVNLIQTVISTLNRLSGILHEPPEAVAQSTHRDGLQRKEFNKLSKLADEVVFVSDIFNHIQQHSGRYKRKKLPGILETLHERALSPRVTAGDRSYIASKFLPNQQNHHETLRFDGDRPVCGTYEKGGDLFISASQCGRIRVYDTRTDQTNLLTTFRPLNEADTLFDCAVSADARFVAYSMTMGKIVLQSIERADMPAHPCQLEGCSYPRVYAPSLHFFPARDEIIAGGTDSQLYFLDLSTLKQTLQLPTDEGRILTLALADPNSQIFYSAGDDGIVKVWDRRALQERDAQPVGVFTGHREAVVFVDSKGDGRYLISNSNDNSIKLWDIRRFAATDDVQNSRKFATEGLWKMTPRRNPNDWFAPTPGDVSVMTYKGHSVDETEIRCRFSPMATTGQRFIYTGCHKGQARIFDLLSGKLLLSLGEYTRFHCIRDVSWHPYLPVIKLSSLDGTVKEYCYSTRPQEHVENHQRWPGARSRVARAIFQD